LLDLLLLSLSLKFSISVTDIAFSFLWFIPFTPGQVSDFGLTLSKEHLSDRRKQLEGSIHWMAPEILNESFDINYMLTDVYSFGIILWELMTREQPYAGMT